MRLFFHNFAVVLVLIIASYAGAQQQPPAKGPSAVVSPKPAVAATVNGQPIMESAVQRGLKLVPEDQHDQARPGILQFLIDNILLDQYLAQHGVTVDQKDVDAKRKLLEDDAKKSDHTYEQLLKALKITDAELRANIEAQLRWDKYTGEQAKDESLRKLFDAEREMFDGTLVRARHILLTPDDDPKAVEKAKGDLALYKKQIEEQADKEGAKLPAQTDAQARDAARVKAVEEAFSDFARKYSACSSKEQGGDVDWFPRGGHMVESFAKAAFALKPHEMSDVVRSPFGYHLILVTDRKAGTETKFEDVKAEVKEVYCARLRESICAKMRPSAKITINAPPNP
jgi:parvulin-like peptidyl-prolyl isomerase